MLDERVKCEQDLTEVQGRYIEQGFEGAMIRHRDSQYAIGKRSSDLFKYKKFLDMECLVTGVWEDKTGLAMLSCETTWGAEFNCTPKRSHDERKNMLQSGDKYIGKWITVKYRGLTDDKIPLFPVGLDFRACDESGNPLL